MPLLLSLAPKGKETTGEWKALQAAAWGALGEQMILFPGTQRCLWPQQPREDGDPSSSVIYLHPTKSSEQHFGLIHPQLECQHTASHKGIT